MAMPAASSASPVPSILDPSNPLAYLAYLPPAVAYESLISSYVLVASLAVHIWDILSSLNEEYDVFMKRPLRLPWFVCWIARLSSLCFLLYNTIYGTAPVGNCETLSRIGPSLFCVALSSTSLMFYLQVTAMYKGQKLVSAFFSSWSLTTVVGVGSGVAIGPTKHCLSGSLKPFVGANVFITFVNDTLVFVATWLRLAQVGLPGNTRFKELIKAAFSLGLLFRDGQAYYLTTASLSLITMVIFYIDSIPLVYRATLPSINLALMNIMACRVYRRWRSGRYKKEDRIPDSDLQLIHLPTDSSPLPSRVVGVTFAEYSVPDDRVWTA
ncbi:hypothetical protein CPB84DRAFT_1781289 [Gymnopilus junonius]|uniref:Uncharacterized protein n=1 Tax=Gymnopilus junonius TaxID=109634 RepID=A0A9P5NP18_GYMJU|nr:hypothetical protein CPB84DRAFT_1781289 [Gymnopilus junonius]